jgi:cell division protein FtsZ
MGEMGKAMMGSATAAGVDRARLAAEAAAASPLLEGVELSGARGVLVNITASRMLGMREVKDVMTTIKTYTHEEATVIFGTVFDDAMEDELRVTVVATGLGGKVVMKPKLETVQTYGLRTGTDDRIFAEPVAGNIETGGLPPVFTSGRARNAAVEAMSASGVDKYDIPAFLRRQAD